MTGRTIPEEAPHEQHVRTPRCHPPGRAADFDGPCCGWSAPPGRAGGVLLHRCRSGRGVGVRQVHDDPRVRARLAPFPRLPLPLTTRDNQPWRRNSSSAACSPGPSPGLLAFVFARIFAEPVINQAISYESGRDAVIAALDKAAGLPAAAAGPGHLQPDHPGQYRDRHRDDRVRRRDGRPVRRGLRPVPGPGRQRPAPHPGPAARRGRVPRDLPGARSSSTPPTRRRSATPRPSSARGGYYLLMVLASVVLADRRGVAREAAEGNGSAPGTRPCWPGPRSWSPPGS